MIHLAPKHLKYVQEILARHVPERRVSAFGSRSIGKRIKPFSDLDLVLFGEEPVSLQTMGDLREAFSESDLPFRVDIVEWARLDQEFRDAISSSLQMVYAPTHQVAT